MNPLLSSNRVPRVFIVEGKNHSVLRGWRHYQIITDGKAGHCMSQPMNAQIAATKFHAKFYARGTWEDDTKPVAPDTMPVPRAEIMVEIYGTNPAAEKRQLAFA
jgi:hypothetical protein